MCAYKILPEKFRHFYATNRQTNRPTNIVRNRVVEQSKNWTNSPSGLDCKGFQRLKVCTSYILSPSVRNPISYPILFLTNLFSFESTDCNYKNSTILNGNYAEHIQDPCTQCFCINGDIECQKRQCEKVNKFFGLTTWNKIHDNIEAMIPASLDVRILPKTTVIALAAVIVYSMESSSRMGTRFLDQNAQFARFDYPHIERVKHSQDWFCHVIWFMIYYNSFSPPKCHKGDVSCSKTCPQVNCSHPAHDSCCYNCQNCQLAGLYLSLFPYSFV